MGCHCLLLGDDQRSIENIFSDPDWSFCFGLFFASLRTKKTSSHVLLVPSNSTSWFKIISLNNLFLGQFIDSHGLTCDQICLAFHGHWESIGIPLSMQSFLHA